MHVFHFLAILVSLFFLIVPPSKDDCFSGLNCSAVRVHSSSSSITFEPSSCLKDPSTAVVILAKEGKKYVEGYLCVVLFGFRPAGPKFCPPFPRMTFLMTFVRA